MGGIEGGHTLGPSPPAPQTNLHPQRSIDSPSKAAYRKGEELMFEGLPPTTARWPLQGSRAAKTRPDALPSGKCASLRLLRAGSVQTRASFIQRSVHPWTPPEWECAKPTPPKVGVCEEDASSFKECANVDASPSGECAKPTPSQSREVCDVDASSFKGV